MPEHRQPPSGRFRDGDLVEGRHFRNKLVAVPDPQASQAGHLPADARPPSEVPDSYTDNTNSLPTPARTASWLGRSVQVGMAGGPRPLWGP